MAVKVRIALVGDFSKAVQAHAAIPMALELSAKALGLEAAAEWVPTRSLAAGAKGLLRGCRGVWCVPGSPYESMEGALAGIRFAREFRRPFLGTCGGFQHALIEHARNVLMLAEADHAESNPSGSQLVIERMECSLFDREQLVALEKGSHLAAIYGAAEAREHYFCNYGVSARHAKLFEAAPGLGGPSATAGLRVSARDLSGNLRAVELAAHPFFLATLFQPELRAFSNDAHPLVTAFLKAASEAD